MGLIITEKQFDIIEETTFQVRTSEVDLLSLLIGMEMPAATAKKCLY